jgi:serine/threonine-protein kinase
VQSDISPGTVLAGKFRVERVIGQGGMGVVIEATHLSLDQRVALKFLLPAALRQADVVTRFAREARAAAKIKSEHVARVIDVGALATGAPYIVMEYLDGKDLSRKMKEGGPLAVSEASLYVLQACEALAEAHKAGIVHRDLKPSNLFLTSFPDGTPCVKILDFGISKLVVPGSMPDLSMTSTATVMGSPHYMSPEQMRSTRDVDLRTDIWAIGVILYELVSGRVPFDAETMPQLCSLVLEQAPAKLATAPARFEALVLRCLEKDPQRRFADVLELATALGEFAPPEAQRSIARIARLGGSRPGSNAPSEPAPPNDGGVTGATGSSRATFALTTREHQGRQALWVGLAALLVLAALGWIFLGPAPRGASLPEFSSGPGPSHFVLPDPAKLPSSPAACVRALSPEPSRDLAPNPAPRAPAPPPSSERAPAPARRAAEAPARASGSKEAAATYGKRDRKKKSQKAARGAETRKATPPAGAAPSAPSNTPDPLNGRL